MRAVLTFSFFLALTCAAAPAWAELYRWVDERGVTNYSNDPPPPAATANKLTRVENTLSVYTPDESFLQAVKAARERAHKTLSEPEPPRMPVARLAPPPAGHEQCLAAGRIGCDDLYPVYYPVYYPGRLPAAVFPSLGVRATRFLPPPAPAPDRTRVARSPPR